jgi:hypothetical protein
MEEGKMIVINMTAGYMMRQKQARMLSPHKKTIP